MSGEAQQPSPDSTITLLLEFPFKEHAESELTSCLKKLRAEPLLAEASLSAWLAVSGAVVTCYIDGAAATGVLDRIRSVATACVVPVVSGSIELSRLQKIAVHAGASHGEPAPFHYVVRTDVEAGGDDELQRWYDEEHMAMLAAVPGTIRARRFVSVDARPRYYACYDLVAPEVLTSAEWLKVRQTPWSQRVRPTFRNTRRVVSRRLGVT